MKNRREEVVFSHNYKNKIHIIPFTCKSFWAVNIYFFIKNILFLIKKNWFNSFDHSYYYHASKFEKIEELLFSLWCCDNLNLLTQE